MSYRKTKLSGGAKFWLWIGVLSVCTILIWELIKEGPPEVGDKRWCTEIRAKPTGDWTLDEARAYAEHNCMRFEPAQLKNK